MKREFNRIQNDKDLYLSKDITLKYFFGILKLNFFSEYRQNGEWKHFVTLSIFNKRIAYICHRTGSRNYVEQNMYFPQIVKGINGHTENDHPSLISKPNDNDLVYRNKKNTVEVIYCYGLKGDEIED